jgi:hypothetical protein
MKESWGTWRKRVVGFAGELFAFGARWGKSVKYLTGGFGALFSGSPNGEWDAIGWMMGC